MNKFSIKFFPFVILNTILKQSKIFDIQLLKLHRSIKTKTPFVFLTNQLKKAIIKSVF